MRTENTSRFIASYNKESCLQPSPFISYKKLVLRFLYINSVKYTKILKAKILQKLTWPHVVEYVTKLFTE